MLLWVMTRCWLNRGDWEWPRLSSLGLLGDVNVRTVELVLPSSRWDEREMKIKHFTLQNNKPEGSILFQLTGIFVSCWLAMTLHLHLLSPVAFSFVHSLKFHSSVTSCHYFSWLENLEAALILYQPWITWRLVSGTCLCSSLRLDSFIVKKWNFIAQIN